MHSSATPQHLLAATYSLSGDGEEKPLTFDDISSRREKRAAGFLAAK
jgi:hypothetical protein